MVESSTSLVAERDELDEPSLNTRDGCVVGGVNAIGSLCVVARTAEEGKPRGPRR